MRVLALSLDVGIFEAKFLLYRRIRIQLTLTKLNSRKPKSTTSNQQKERNKPKTMQINKQTAERTNENHNNAVV